MNPSRFAWTRLTFASQRLERDHYMQRTYSLGARTIRHYLGGLLVEHRLGDTK